MNRYSSTIDKHRKQVNELDKAAAKHLVKLGVEKDWRDVYRRMQNRRKKHERST
mgnify:FL=1